MNELLDEDDLAAKEYFNKPETDDLVPRPTETQGCWCGVCCGGR